MNYFDSHCHLTLTELPIEEHIEAIREAGIRRIFDPGLEIVDLAVRTETLKAYPEVLRGGGIAPHSRYQTRDLEEDLRTLEAYLKAKQLHAIGEIGLEYFHVKDPAQHENQKKLFNDQLKLAKQYNLPVSLHLRSGSYQNAYADAVTCLKAAQLTAPVIAHCFVGNMEDATQMLSTGAFISFSGILTFRSANTLQDIAKKLPRDRILIETDAPFLTPVPMRGKPNMSPYLVHTQKFLSNLLEVDEEELSEQLFKNAQTAFQHQVD